MAANDQHIFLGWKNRIVIYNLDGTKHDDTRLQSTEIYGELCDLIWSSAMQRFFYSMSKISICSLSIAKSNRTSIEPLSNQSNESIHLVNNIQQSFIFIK